MGKRVSAEVQKEAVSKLLEDVSSIEGVEGEVLTRTNGTQDRNIAHITCQPSAWRDLAETMKYDHLVDHCSMITGDSLARLERKKLGTGLSFPEDWGFGS